MKVKISTNKQKAGKYSFEEVKERGGIYLWSKQENSDNSRFVFTHFGNFFLDSSGNIGKLVEEIWREAKFTEVFEKIFIEIDSSNN